MRTQRFKTEEEYTTILKETIENIKMECKNCKAPTRLVKNSLDRAVCTDSLCRRRQSVFTNTIFSGRKISKLTLIQTIDSWLNGCSTKSIEFFLGVQRKTIRGIVKALESKLIPDYYNNFEKIGGEEIIVEIDESKFGKRKYNIGHKVDGVWVVGIVERTPERKIYLVDVEKRDKQTLTKLITANVNKESTIYTDCWKGYGDLKNHFAKHETVNHSKTFKNKENNCCTNAIEGTWSAIKTQIPFRKRTKKLITLYLIRFMLIRNQKSDALKYLLNLLL